MEKNAQHSRVEHPIHCSERPNPAVCLYRPSIPLSASASLRNPRCTRLTCSKVPLSSVPSQLAPDQLSPYSPTAPAPPAKLTSATPSAAQVSSNLASRGLLESL